MAKGKTERDSDAATARRGRPRSAETTNAILQSAYTLMATTGLATTSIDAIKSRIASNPLFSETFERMITHLTDNKIEIAGIKPVLGASLTFDPVKEVYTGGHADAANALNLESYREGFTIPNA